MTVNAQIALATESLANAIRLYSPAVFTTSLGSEDMVLLDLIHRHRLDVQVLTLDTGRLHDETYALLDQVQETYGKRIEVLFPDAQALEPFVAREGVNAFYRSLELRKQCCEIRKVQPLRRALKGKRLWITGLRRAQSTTRVDLPALAHDAQYDLMKINPLLDWSSAQVADYLRQFDVPTNALHQRGYPSIGCAPCTRAISVGEDERAGRWWWEQAQSRECGLHMAPDGARQIFKTEAV